MKGIQGERFDMISQAEGFVNTSFQKSFGRSCEGRGLAPPALLVVVIKAVVVQDIGKPAEEEKKDKHSNEHRAASFTGPVGFLLRFISIGRRRMKFVSPLRDF